MDFAAVVIIVDDDCSGEVNSSKNVFISHLLTEIIQINAPFPISVLLVTVAGVSVELTSTIKCNIHVYLFLRRLIQSTNLFCFLLLYPRSLFEFQLKLFHLSNETFMFISF